MGIFLFFSVLSAETGEYVAVAPFMVRGMSETESEMLRDNFIKAYNGTARYKAVEKEKIDFIMEETEFHKNDLPGEMSYALALGRLLSVRFVILGKIGKSEKESTCILKVIDSEAQKYILTFNETNSGTAGKLLSLAIGKIISAIDPLVASGEQDAVTEAGETPLVKDPDTGVLINEETSEAISSEKQMVVDPYIGFDGESSVDSSAEEENNADVKPKKESKAFKKDKHTQSEVTPVVEKKKSKKKSGVIAAVTTGVGLAVAIPAYLYLRSKEDGSGDEDMGTFSLTIEW